MRAEAFSRGPRYTGSASASAIQSWAVASLGMRQSPRGERLIEPTFGPSGRADRLNCWGKKRRRNVTSHFLTVARSYRPSKARQAMKNSLAGENP